MTPLTPTPLHCKVCTKPLRGQQRFYCGRPCKRRAYSAQRKLREAQELADKMEAQYYIDRQRDEAEVQPPSLLRRSYAYIQLLAHTLYHIFDGWRTRK